MLTKFWIGASAAVLLALSGCGASGGSDEAKRDLKAVREIATPDEANGAIVTGKVIFAGPKPTVRNLDMSATPFCTRNHPGGAPSEEIVVNRNGTLRNVFVRVKSGLPDKQWQATLPPAILDQQDCMYKPHVLAVMVGQPVTIKNSDGTNHNVHAIPKVNREWNESQPPSSPDKIQSFPRPELMLTIKCNIHPWMRSYINVVEHPFFAVTGEDGSFTIKGLPPGTYTLEFVHEKFASQEQQITVGARETKTADFTVRG